MLTIVTYTYVYTSLCTYLLVMLVPRIYEHVLTVLLPFSR